MLPTAARSGRSPAARKPHRDARARLLARAADGWGRPGLRAREHGMLRSTCWLCWQHRPLDVIRNSMGLAPVHRFVAEALRARGSRLSSRERTQDACGQLAGRNHLLAHIWAIAALDRCVRPRRRSLSSCSRWASQTYRRAQRKHARRMVAATSVPEGIPTVEARPRQDLRTGAWRSLRAASRPFLWREGLGMQKRSRPEL